MLYTPVPATPLYQQMTEQERMLDDVELADIHRQFKFNFRQSAISRDETGPSLFRICRTLFNGWQRYKDHPTGRVRARFTHQAHKLRTTYNAALWAMERRLKRGNPQVALRIRGLRRDMEAALGLPTRVQRMMLGPILAWTSKREDRQLANGLTYEPQTFVGRHNWLAGGVCRKHKVPGGHGTTRVQAV